MKLLKWIPLFWSLLIYGQEDSIFQIDGEIEIDSMWYINSQNNFSFNDDVILLGYENLETSIMGNFGSVLIPFWWKSENTIEQKIGDRILRTNTNYSEYAEVYKENFPHTKIIYSPTYSDNSHGQRLNFSHKKRYRYGSFLLDYDRLVSEGFLAHENKKQTLFNLHGNYSHPKQPYECKWRINTFKQESEWNGGISNENLFFASSQSNWEVIPVHWLNLETSIKHKEFDWKHTYSFSKESKLEYEINMSQDSMFYNGLEDDTLFYPNRLDSTSSFNRGFTNMTHTLKWSKQLNEDKHAVVGVKNQNFKQNKQGINRWGLFTSIHSNSLNSHIHLSFGKDEFFANSFKANYSQQINFMGLKNDFKIAYEKTIPNWHKLIHSMTWNLNASSPFTQEIINPSIDQYIEWNLEISKNISIHNSYHNIEAYAYFNEQAQSVNSDEIIKIFQHRVKHHFRTKNWHWRGDTGYQNISSNNIPLAKLMFNQRLYWQNKIFKNATETQIGVNVRYRSRHPGMTYSPILGDFYISPQNETNASIKCDVFANFQIQTLKIYAAFEHLNSLWQGEQYTLKPYPIAKPIFRLSLIWNFYD